MENTNIQSKIDNNLNFDIDQIINIFTQAFKANKDNIKIFLNNENLILDLLEQYNIEITPIQYNQIKKSLFDIRKIIEEKDIIDEEIKQYLNMKQDYIPEECIDSKIIVYILFIILIIAIICHKSLSKQNIQLRYY